MDLPTHFGQYELVKKIASGGMAEIYLARTGGIQGFEKYLVLKMIHPKWSRDAEFISMLVEEAKLAVQLNHTNIAQIFDLGRQDDTYYIAMEYVDGKDLFQLLVRTSEMETFLPFDVSAYLIEQAAAALHYAHSKIDPYGRNLGLIHRDVSPQNVIVSFNGEVKLIDFGIAKAAVREGHTQVGIIKGKFYYMSPEQAWGRPLDHRTDIFSLGICLHEMLTGQMLYAEENQLKLLEMVRQANIPRPSRMRQGVPPELEAIAMRALEPDASRRFQSAYELQRALTEFLHRRAPGFTPNRCARLMWDLFPNDTPQFRQQPEAPINRNEFTQAAPPDSVIFDLSRLPGAAAQSTGVPALPGPPPMPAPPLPPAQRPNEAVGRRSSTRQVATPERAAGLAPPVMDEDAFLTGDGLGANYPSNAPMPVPGGPPGSNLEFHESTQIVNWDRYKERHPERSVQIHKVPNGSPPPLPLPPLPNAEPFGEDSATNLYDQAFLRPPGLPSGPPPPSAAGLQPLPSLDDEDSGSTVPMSMDEATQFFNRSAFAPGPSAPPPPRPAPSAPSLEDSHTSPARGGDKPMTREEKIAAAKAKAKGGGGGPPGAGAPPPPADPPPSGDKPMTREEKIAAAKAKAKGGGGGPPSGGAPAPSGDKPMTREEKIAAAKAKAKGGGGDGPSPAPGGGGAMSLEEKIAAAKAKAKGGGGGPDLKDKIKKKGAAPAEDEATVEGSIDDMPPPGSPADKIAAAKAKARAKAQGGGAAAKSGATPRGPNIVKGSKGNAGAGNLDRVKVAGARGPADPNAPGAKIVALITNKWVAIGAAVVFIVGVFGIYGVVKLVNTVSEPETATIEVTSVPSGADIEFDGNPLGATTPFTITNVSIDAPHIIRVTLKTYEDKVESNILAKPGEIKSVNLLLTPSPGTLFISSDPPGATVMINGEPRGETPGTITGLSRTDGPFLDVELQKEGYKPKSIPLQWQVGELQITHHEKLDKLK